MIAALALALALLSAEPMTSEEVVRRLAAGEAVEAVLSDVRRREPAFDVSPEMLDEMRRAGVPEEVLAAMIARAPAPPPPPPPPPAAMAEMRLTAARAALTISRNLGPQLVAELDLPAGALDADAAALAVLCGAGDHKDPHSLRWPEGKVPKRLGQHRLLALLPAGETGRSGRSLRVTLPSPLVVPLAADLSHDLVVAVVARAGGQWAVLGEDELRGVRAPVDASLDFKGLPGALVAVTLRRQKDATLPELPRGEGFSREGASGVSGTVLSPDGRKRVVARDGNLSLEIEGEPAPGLALELRGEVEVLWSASSRVVAVTDPSAVRVWRIEPDDAVHPVPLTSEVKGRVAAVAFPEDGKRLLLVGRDGGRLVGYLLRTEDGSLASRYTELEVRSRWKDRLGPRLR